MLALAMRRIRFKFGETVLREGSHCRDMFLVEAGTLRIAGKDLIVGVPHPWSHRGRATPRRRRLVRAPISEREAPCLKSCLGFMFVHGRTIELRVCPASHSRRVQVIATGDVAVYMLPYGSIMQLLRCKEMKFIVALASELREKHGRCRLNSPMKRNSN